MKHIILIGFMGSGKTSLGSRLAKAMKRSFVDTDERIVKESGMTVEEIFRQEGEAGFRRRETESLRNLLKESEPAVISVGGGLPVQPENHLLLQKLGTVIYLQTSLETLKQRLAGSTGRPLLKGQDLEARIRELMDQREEIYQEVADLFVDTDGKTFRELISEIENRLEYR